MVSEREEAVSEAFEQLRQYLSYSDLKGEHDIFDTLENLFGKGQARARVYFTQVNPVVEEIYVHEKVYEGDVQFGAIRVSGEGRYKSGSFSFATRKGLMNFVEKLMDLRLMMKDKEIGS